MTDITGQSLIAGEWITPAGKEYTSINPYTKEVFNAFKSCGVEEIEKAVSAAAYAYQQMRKMDGETIGTFLEAVADEIEALGDILLETGDTETGLGLARMTGERGRTTGQIRAFAAIAKKGEWVEAAIDTAIPDRAPLPKPDLRRMMTGIGPVAVFGASNFPFAFGVLGGDTASALAAGNPVIVKGHSAHPATSELFAKAIDAAIQKTGFPKGAFSLLQGANRELGTELVKHPVIQAVGFTGSEGGGRALMDIAAARPQPIPVYAEMGSINPVFLGPNTIKSTGDGIAAGLAGSVCMGTGQFCTSPGLAIMLEDANFEAKMVEALDAAPRGYLLNPRIQGSLQDAFKRFESIEGCEWLNKADFEEGSMTPPNAVFKTTGDVFLKEPELAEEAFGPVNLMVVCKDEVQMLEVGNSLKGQLTGSIHADEDPELAKAVLAILEQKVGRIIFNGYPTGVEVCPSQQHGGPYPSSSVSWATSVGADAIRRFARFVSYQATPDAFLPSALKNDNPLNIFRKVNGEMSQAKIG